MKKTVARMRVAMLGKRLVAILTAVALAAYFVPAFAAAQNDDSAQDEQVIVAEDIVDSAAVDEGTSSESSNAEDVEEQESEDVDNADLEAVEEPDEGCVELAECEDDAIDDDATEDGVAEDEAPEDAQTVIADTPKKAKRAARKAAGNSGDFTVSGVEGADWTFTDGVLTVLGDVTISTSAQTTQRIVVSEDATLTLDGVDIAAANGAALLVDAGVNATVLLASGSTNTLVGAANYAGLGVDYEDGNLASLTVDGSGTLNATGGDRSAGIGGSYTNKTTEGKNTSSYCGNITIKGGTIEANGTNGGAGIGSASNNGTNSDGSTQSASYKMQHTQIGAITIDGGTITATGNYGAGIGGGNHCDSGVITVNAGTITASSNDGAGIGCGRGSSNYGGDAEKGHGYFYADVTINGGTITADGGWLSAGIGGGYECDAIIAINGGTIERAVGGNGNSGSYYQGAPGIGAGYQGNVQLTMTDGTIKLAQGGWSAPGIGYGAGIQDYGSKRKADGEHVSAKDSFIKIEGGTIDLAQGGMYAAGIGSGNGCPVCNIEITGGDITAKGWASSETEMLGGAGIGSGVGAESGLKYSRDSDVSVSITGGSVLAVGGWGASGIGSGAVNKMAEQITIDAGEAAIEAYADGTKFAIDTRVLDADGTTSSQTEGRSITGDVLQGTFVHDYTSEDNVEQGTEGLQSFTVASDATGEAKTLTNMPAGYRSFATDVAGAGSYTVFSADKAIAEGSGSYFNVCTMDEYDKGEVTARNIKYRVSSSELSDNYYLFPVKTIVVSKEIVADDAIREGIDQTLHFALWNDAEKVYVNGEDGKPWVETVEVVGGVPQGSAYFANVPAGTYGIWEVSVTGQGEVEELVTPLAVTETVSLTKVTTRHEASNGSTDTDNDATISDKVYTDKVVVENTYETTTIDDDDPPLSPNDATDDDPDDPDDEEDPDTDDSDDSDDDADDDDTPLTSPQTGDDDMAGLAMGFLAMTALGSAALVRRKRAGA